MLDQSKGFVKVGATTETNITVGLPYSNNRDKMYISLVLTTGFGVHSES